MKYDDSDDYDESLPWAQAGVHLKLFVAWVVDRNLHVNAEGFDDPELTEGYRRRERTREQLFGALDGKLGSEELGPEANAFVRRYYPERYFEDFDEVCVRDDGSVDDSDRAYERLCAVLDRRFTGSTAPARPWWAFWRR